MHEEFADQVFRDNFRNYFALNDFGELKVASGGQIDINLSDPLKVKGAFGPIHSLANKSKLASKEKLGEGDTSSWFLGGVDQNLSLTFFLDISKGTGPVAVNSSAYI